MGIFHITLDAGGIFKSIKNFIQRPEHRHIDRSIDQRKHERRYKEEKRTYGELNLKSRFVCGLRPRVYLEFRKGDQEILDLTYSNYARLEKVVSAYLVNQRFNSRNVGNGVKSRKVVDYAINAVKRQMGADNVDFVRIGVLVDQVIDAIWTKYIVLTPDRRVVERRQISIEKIRAPREIGIDTPIPA